MRVLLVASHTTILEFDRLGKLPSLSLSSIAANIDKDLIEDVKIVDLLIAGRKPTLYYQRLLKEYQPDVVGFGCMVFQYDDSLELAKLTKQFNKNITTVFGGYGPTVITDEIIESDDMRYIDFLVRGEGEHAFNELLKALQNKIDTEDVPNISYRQNGSIIHNPAGKLIDLDTLKIPDRDARILTKGFHAAGYTVDAIETSRGCVLSCNFCTIREMYGKKFRKYKIERIIEDIRDTDSRGTRGLFIVDDNITLDGKRYMDICDAIIDAKLNHIMYGVQASVKGLAKTPGLVKKMADAGHKVVFLGLENSSEEALAYMSKDGQYKHSDAYQVVHEFIERGVGVIGGIILGYPEDTEESIWANYEYCQKIGVGNPIWFILTPYPKTKIRDDLLEQGLITNLSDYSRYTGFEANIKTKHLSSKELKDLREHLGFRYFAQAGSFIAMFIKEPIFSTRLFFNQLFNEPKQVFLYIKEILRISNYRKFNSLALKYLTGYIQNYWKNLRCK